MSIDETLRKSLQNLKKQPYFTQAARVLSVSLTEKTAEVEPVIHGVNKYDVRLKAKLSTQEGLELIPSIGSIVLVSMIHNEDSECFISLYSTIDSARIKIGNYWLQVQGQEQPTAQPGSGTLSQDDEPAIPGITLTHQNDEATNEIFLDDQEIRIKNSDRELRITPDQIRVQDGTNTVLLNNEGITLNDGSHGGLVIAQELANQSRKNTDAITMIANALNSGVPSTGAPDSGAALITSIKAGLPDTTNLADLSNIENQNVKHG